MSKAPIAILGAGNMASALALNLARLKRPVRLYCIEEDVEEDFRKHQQNSRYLAGYSFPKHVTTSSSIAATLHGAEDIFIAIPSFAVEDVILEAKPFFTKKIQSIVSVTKGLHHETLQPIVLSEAAILPVYLRKHLCTLGGPAIANELAKNSPTGFLLAGSNKATVQRVKKLLETATTKCATSSDVLGVGLASALKNPYAIALGMCDGLKLPANAKSLVLTLAVEEIQHFVVASGGDGRTAFGLAGLGDLVVTGLSPSGRNRTYGELLVGASSKKPADLELGTVEGIPATSLAVKLARRLKIQTLLLDAVDHCLRKTHHFEQPFVHYLTHLQLS